MPPRYAYWTILVDGQPTAFRAAEPDELLPTLKRLQVKQPGATMKWFERGRLWESRDEAKDKLGEGYTVGPDGALVPPDAAAGRGKGWRPGGEHKDPREKYQLAKKAKWQKFKQMVRSRPGHGPKPGEGGDQPVDETPVEPGFEDPAFDDASFGGGEFEDVTAQYLADDGKPVAGEGETDGGADSGASSETGADADGGTENAGQDPSPPSGDAAPPATDWRGRPRPEGDGPPAKRAWSGDRPKPAWRDKPGGGEAGGGVPGWTPRPDARGPRPDWKSRPDARGPKPDWKSRPDARGPRPGWTPRPDARGPKPEWRDKPAGDRGSWTPRPDARGPKPEWRDRPSGDRPGGDRPGGYRPGGESPARGSPRRRPALERPAQAGLARQAGRRRPRRRRTAGVDAASRQPRPQARMARPPERRSPWWRPARWRAPEWLSARRRPTGWGSAGRRPPVERPAQAGLARQARRRRPRRRRPAGVDAASRQPRPQA